MSNWPTISKELNELLDVVRYASRDKRCRSIYAHKPFVDTDKDFQRIVKMKKLGRKLCPNSYKRLHVLHINYGTDAWKIRISSDRSSLTIDKDNWGSFEYWVQSLMRYAPTSAAYLMQKYPHVRAGNGKT